MHPLRLQMIEDLRLRGRAQNAIDAYTRCVRKFFDWSSVAPGRVKPTDVRAFLLHLMYQRRLSCARQDVSTGALKVFFRVTMRRPDVVAEIPHRKVPMRLPGVLSQVQAAELIDAASTLKHRAMFMTMYGAGLRVSGLCKLETPDINGRRMVIHVGDASRGRDRQAFRTGFAFAEPIGQPMPCRLGGVNNAGMGLNSERWTDERGCAA